MTIQPTARCMCGGSVSLLTEQEAATMAKVSKKTIRRLIKQKRLPAVDYGTGSQHNYRINPDDLLRIQPTNGSESTPMLRPRSLTPRHYIAPPAVSFLPRVSA